MTPKDFETTVRFTVGNDKRPIYEFIPDPKQDKERDAGYIAEAGYFTGHVCNVEKITASGIRWYNYTFGKRSSGLLKFETLKKIEHETQSA